MSKGLELLTQVEEITTSCVSNFATKVKQIGSIKCIVEQMLEAEERYEQNGDAEAYKDELYLILNTPNESKSMEKDESLKENNNSVEKTLQEVADMTQSQRKVLVETSQTINYENGIKIKQERKSTESLIVPISNIKVEKDDMPPPAEPIKKRRPGRPKLIKAEKIEPVISSRPASPTPSESSRNSDVVLNPTKVSMIVLDSDDEALKDVKKPARSTRTKKKKEAEKRTRSPSEEEIKKPHSTRTKRKKEESVYQDAVTTIEISKPSVMLEQIPQKVMEEMLKKNQTIINPNETVVIEKAAIVNQTMVIEKNVNETVIIDKNATRIVDKTPTNISNIMTDDESLENIQQQSNKVGKPIFNLFENSPVKKRVEAFEKLGQTAVDAPSRMTRTKSKKKAANGDEQPTTKPSQIPVKGSEVTPLATNKFLPPLSHSTTSKMRHGSIESLVPAKSLSAIKASQKEYREREQRRKEKEAEAAKKKEALIQAQIEEKRRKREEKELKAKLHREELEREKQRSMELQKQKEEKQKQLLSEKHEKLRKQREEAEKKRQLVKQRAEERMEEEERKKKIEDDIRREERRKKMEERAAQKKIEEYKKNIQKEKPIYMKQVAPLLPSHDCYDSDDESTNKKTIERPKWTKRDQLSQSLKVMEFIDDKLKNTFFFLMPQTPDLREIFENIDPQMLRRNSSAIWNNAPRFTLMPDFQDNL